MVFPDQIDQARKQGLGLSDTALVDVSQDQPSLTQKRLISQPDLDVKSKKESLQTTEILSDSRTFAPVFQIRSPGGDVQARTEPKVRTRVLPENRQASKQRARLDPSNRQTTKAEPKSTSSTFGAGGSLVLVGAVAVGGYFGLDYLGVIE